MIELSLPWPPTVNHFKRPGRLCQTKSGKFYQPRVNTAETNAYFFEVWKKVRGLGQAFKFDASAAISLEVDAYPPDSRKRDLDNICKVLCDALVHAKLIADDSQIARLLVTRMSIIRKGQVVIRITELKS